jgi:hypothetical protein
MQIAPKEIQIDGKTFVIHKLPATVAVEVMMRSAGNAIPKAGDFAVVEEMMLKTMAYASIRRKDLPDLQLNSRELIDNHCVDYKTYLKVLEEVRQHSQLFGIAGNLLTFFESVIQMLPAKIAKMLTDVSLASSTRSSPPSTNSEQSTH